MAENTAIEWCDHTFNPWEGCTKVSPGCDHCYAEARNARFGGGEAVNWGPGAPRRRTSDANWQQPLRWNKRAEREGRRMRVFCASLADVFDNEVPAEWRADLFNLIANTPHLDWLLLTKRVGNARAMLDAYCASDGHTGERWDGWPNVWIGATVVNQAEADRDVPKLLTLPAARRFLSMEPLLGHVSLTTIGEYTHPWININALTGWTTRGQLAMSPSQGSSQVACGKELPPLDWVIVGGESGPNARPMQPDWARSLRDQCAAAGVPFFFKQWGEYTAHEVDADSYHPHLSCIDANGGECALSRGDMAREKGEPWWFLPPWPGRGTWGPDGIPAGVLEVRRVGKKAAGRLLDGRTHDAFPEVR